MKEFDELVSIMARLREPGGCPWDREQDHKSIVPYLIEEAYEVVEAIEKSDDDDLKEELGDLVLQVVFHARMAEERGAFDIRDVLKGICSKLIRRHPHVFGDGVNVSGSGEVLRNWEDIKKREGKKSAIEGVPAHLPALQRAWRVGEKAGRVGFDWPAIDGVLEKVGEEIGEIAAVFKKGGDKKRVEEEFGDLLFTLANLARHMDIDAEGALRGAVDKFSGRFKLLEREVEKSGRNMKEMSVDELEEIWQRIKSRDSLK